MLVRVTVTAFTELLKTTSMLSMKPRASFMQVLDAEFELLETTQVLSIYSLKNADSHTCHFLWSADFGERATLRDTRNYKDLSSYTLTIELTSVQ